MRLTLLTGAAVLLGLAQAQSSSTTFIPFVTPLAHPAPQTSVTSTAFNPAETNAGGTTNSAGTFNVVSLARSSSHAFDSVLPQTTSFSAVPASFANAASESTPAYYSDSINTAVPKLANQQSSAEASSIMLSTSASVMAQKTATGDGAISWVYGGDSMRNGLGMAMGLFAAAVLGGAAVL